MFLNSCVFLIEGEGILSGMWSISSRYHGFVNSHYDQRRYVGVYLLLQIQARFDEVSILSRMIKGMHLCSFFYPIYLTDSTEL